MTRWSAALGAIVLALGTPAFGGGEPPVPAAPPPNEPAHPPAGSVDAPLTEKAWLEEIVRHMYRWYIDERDIDVMVQAKEVVFWVRELHPKLDEGDKSRFGDVVLPQLGLEVKVKKADYTIPEFNAVVKNDTYRITHVDEVERPAKRPEGSIEVRLPYEEVRDDLFRARSKVTFPDGALLEHMRASVRTEVAKDQANLPPGVPPVDTKQTQVVYLASLSAVANETWVFWETGHSLIRFASDIDLSNPVVWEHEKLAAHLYHLDSKVVVSLDEVSGSNAFMTRDEAGRVLFNCVVLGKRLELEPGKKVDEGRK